MGAHVFHDMGTQHARSCCCLAPCCHGTVSCSLLASPGQGPRKLRQATRASARRHLHSEQHVRRRRVARGPRDVRRLQPRGLRPQPHAALRQQRVRLHGLPHHGLHLPHQRLPERPRLHPGAPLLLSTRGGHRAAGSASASSGLQAQASARRNQPDACQPPPTPLPAARGCRGASLHDRRARLQPQAPHTLPMTLRPLAATMHLPPANK